jgi:predicted Zn-dependent protease with MMP-like domain
MDIQFRDIDVQLTEIYKDYDKDRKKHKVKDAEHLVNLAKSQIKEQFRDQTGAFYVVIERDGHEEMLKSNSLEFDRYLYRLYYDADNTVVTHTTIKNSKRLLESYTTETRPLYNRIAKTDDVIYYDLNNEEWQCVKISKYGWSIEKCPMIFYRGDANNKQVQPRLQIEQNRSIDKDMRPVRDLINRFFITNEYQRTIAEVYVIALFIPDIAIPIILPCGPRASGKTLFLRSIRQILDPRPFLALVERLPRDDKDRRVAVINSYFACFDNESHLGSEIMDEICTWVTGISMSVRELYTTDEIRTFSAKRALGVTGINIPVTNSDALNRALILDMDSIPDGIDENSESMLIAETKFIDDVRKLLPDILKYIFDVIVKALQIHDDVEKQVKPNHRLADFVIWGEIISRVIGNKENEFLDAWSQNVEQQNVSALQNNTFAELVIDFVFNYHSDKPEIIIEPMQLYSILRYCAEEKKLDVKYARWFPQSPAWMTRELNKIRMDLRAANILVETGRDGHRRWIRFKKILK